MSTSATPVRYLRSLGAAAIATSLLALSACSGSALGGEDDSGSEGPVKIGLLIPQSGVYKSLGDDMKAGFEVYLEQNDNQLGGREVEVIIADEGESPDTGKAAAAKLLEQDQVAAVTGVVSSLTMNAIADEFVAKIAERTRTLRTGDGMGESDMGPLVTRAHLDKVTGYVEEGVASGAELVIDGREGAGDLGEGFFLKPTLFDRVTPEMSIYTDEIFGPVLSVVRVGSYDEGLQLINDNPYGNGTTIFTNDGGAARRFQHEVEVGMVGINVPIPTPMAYYSFGGWKNSLFGDTHAHGIEGVHFFTRTKAVTQRWLDPSHGGLNLGFPQND